MIAFDFGPKFSLGRVVITAQAALDLPVEDIHWALHRHARGDWGDVDPHDQEQNRLALEGGGMLLSVYRARNGTKFWIVTEGNRDSTTVMLPEDY